MTKEEALEILDWIPTKGDEVDALEMAIEALKECKTGKWFDTANVYDKRANKHDYFCLECKTNAMDFIGGSEDWWCCKPPKYCPNCGAKMEGTEDEETD